MATQHKKRLRKNKKKRNQNKVQLGGPSMLIICYQWLILILGSSIMDTFKILKKSERSNQKDDKIQVTNVFKVDNTQDEENKIDSYRKETPMEIDSTRMLKNSNRSQISSPFDMKKISLAEQEQILRIERQLLGQYDTEIVRKNKTRQKSSKVRFEDSSYANRSEFDEMVRQATMRSKKR